jgi:Xaa-Pro aminopeptidase
LTPASGPAYIRRPERRHDDEIPGCDGQSALGIARHPQTGALAVHLTEEGIVIGGASKFERIRAALPEIQATLREHGLDGWLLYDLHARNTAASGLLELGDLSRRYFVLIPAEGEPHALTHGIEQGPWHAWPWEKESYVSWRSLDEAMRRLVSGRNRVAMEFSARDAVPACDLVPAGVIELIRSAGGEISSSGDLITRFYSRWTAAQLQAHYRAAEVLADVADASFDWLYDRVSKGETTAERDFHEHVVGSIRTRGFSGEGCISATARSASNPHHDSIESDIRLSAGDVVLLDLWCKESDDAVYADQTWMACMGPNVPERAAELFGIVCAARDAAVDFLMDAWKEGRTVRGYEVDDTTRGVIDRAGYGSYFIHRTGHSIDTAIHGMGPNMDNLETHETRFLIPGVGFSIEPGIYMADDIGLRSEINVYIGDDGPVVTPSRRQTSIRICGG